MNEFEFIALYGVEFGAKDNQTVYPDYTSSHFRINFMTPGHSEQDVRIGISTMAFVMDKTIALRLFSADDTLLYETNRSFSFFVNKDGVDPKPLLVRDDTHGGQQYEVPRETHLLPFTRYALECERTKGHSANQPLGIIHVSNDFNQELYGIRMPMGGVDGIWTPLD